MLPRSKAGHGYDREFWSTFDFVFYYKAMVGNPVLSDTLYQNEIQLQQNIYFFRIFKDTMHEIQLKKTSVTLCHGQKSLY